MNAGDHFPDQHAKWGDLLTSAYTELHHAQQRITTLERELADLKKQLPDATAKVAEPYSLRAEEQRQAARGTRAQRKETKKQRRGRRAHADKSKRAEKTQDIYPQDVPRERCQLSHVRLVWRFRDDRATLVA